MKSSILTLALAILAVIPFHAQAMENDMAAPATPVVKAVFFYADSCGVCKILEPKVTKALSSINPEKLDVIKFDFSNKATINATKELAKEKNINDILQKYGAKTGFVVLVNNNNEIVDTLKVDNEAPEMASKLATAIVNASL